MDIEEAKNAVTFEDMEEGEKHTYTANVVISIDRDGEEFLKKGSILSLIKDRDMKQIEILYRVVERTFYQKMGEEDGKAFYDYWKRVNGAKENKVP